MLLVLVPVQSLRRVATTGLLLHCCIAITVDAWRTIGTPIRRRQPVPRRDALKHLIIAASCALIAAPAQAIPEGVFNFGAPLTNELALDRFQKGRDSLNSLIQDFDTVVENGGGDGVRRYLGTVGTTSGLWGISKVLNYIKENVDVDIVEFSELQLEVEAALRAADSASYMAIFVATSSSSVPPSKYFEDARREAKTAKVFYDQIAKLIHV